MAADPVEAVKHVGDRGSRWQILTAIVLDASVFLFLLIVIGVALTETPTSQWYHLGGHAVLALLGFLAFFVEDLTIVPVFLVVSSVLAIRLDMIPLVENIELLIDGDILGWFVIADVFFILSAIIYGVGAGRILYYNGWVLEDGERVSRLTSDQQTRKDEAVIVAVDRFRPVIIVFFLALMAGLIVIVGLSIFAFITGSSITIPSYFWAHLVHIAGVVFFVGFLLQETLFMPQPYVMLAFGMLIVDLYVLGSLLANIAAAVSATERIGLIFLGVFTIFFTGLSVAYVAITLSATMALTTVEGYVDGSTEPVKSVVEGAENPPGGIAADVRALAAKAAKAGVS